MSNQDERKEDEASFYEPESDKGCITVSGEKEFTKLPPKLARKIGIPIALVLEHVYFRLCISEIESNGVKWAQIPSMDFTKRLPLCFKEFIKLRDEYV